VRAKLTTLEKAAPLNRHGDHRIAKDLMVGLGVFLGFPRFGPWFDQIFPTPVNIYSWVTENVYLYGVFFLATHISASGGQKGFQE